MLIKTQAILNYPEQTRSLALLIHSTYRWSPELRRLSLQPPSKDLWIRTHLKPNAAPNINVEILILMGKNGAISYLALCRPNTQELDIWNTFHAGVWHRTNTIKFCLVWSVCKVKTDGKSQGPRITKLGNQSECQKAVHLPLKLIILADATGRFSKLNLFTDILKLGLKAIVS